MDGLELLFLRTRTYGTHFGNYTATHLGTRVAEDFKKPVQFKKLKGTSIEIPLTPQDLTSGIWE
jgi:hypothetical protein